MADKLRKYKSLFSTTLSSGIGTGTGDTITLASVSGLPTDTEITLTFDRVDADGVETPSKLERIKGTISGGNLTSYTRGVDGTTEQAHLSNCVIEQIYNAADHNDIIDWALTNHKQDGTHTASFIVASYISASSVVAGALAASAVSAGNLAASSVVTGNLAASSVVSGNLAASSVVSGNLAASSVSQGNLNFSIASGLSSKIIAATRDLTASSGDVSYTGVGFQPTAIIALSGLGGGTEGQSWGMADSSGAERAITRGSNGLGYTGSVLCSIEQASGALQEAVLKQYDADGFTLTWTKTGSPTGTAVLYFLCLK